MLSEIILLVFIQTAIIGVVAAWRLYTALPSQWDAIGEALDLLE